MICVVHFFVTGHFFNTQKVRCPTRVGWKLRKKNPEQSVTILHRDNRYFAKKHYHSGHEKLFFIVVVVYIYISFRFFLHSFRFVSFLTLLFFYIGRFRFVSVPFFTFPGPIQVSGQIGNSLKKCVFRNTYLYVHVRG